MRPSMSILLISACVSRPSLNPASSLDISTSMRFPIFTEVRLPPTSHENYTRYSETCSKQISRDIQKMFLAGFRYINGLAFAVFIVICSILQRRVFIYLDVYCCFFRLFNICRKFWKSSLFLKIAFLKNRFFLGNY